MVLLNKLGILCLLFIAAISMTACSDSKQDEPELPTEDSYEEELETLQNNFVVLDENGNIKERVYGRVLDESMPETIFIGVENFDEAREIFTGLFSELTSISEDGCTAIFTTRIGKAELLKSNMGNGLVAQADFDVEGLKFVKSIRFILNSAWPENYDQNLVYRFGYIYEYDKTDWYDWNYIRILCKDDDEKFIRYLCIREYKNGVPALLVGISKYYYTHNDVVGERKVGKTDVELIHKILTSSWTFFKGAFRHKLGPDYLDENSFYIVKKSGVSYKIANLYTGQHKDPENKKKYRMLFLKLENK